MAKTQAFVVQMVIDASDRQRVLDILRTLNLRGATDFHVRSILSVDLVLGEGEELVNLTFAAQRHGERNNFLKAHKAIRKATGFGLMATKDALEAGLVGPLTRTKAEELQSTLHEILGQPVEIASVR